MGKTLSERRRLVIMAGAIAAAGVWVTSHAATVFAQGSTGQETLVVNWDDPELRRFAKEGKSGAASGLNGLATVDVELLRALRLPVIGFKSTPALVRKALGAQTQPVVARKLISDRQTPLWYHLVDNYGDISITVDADLRINHSGDDEFRIHRGAIKAKGSEGGGKTQISIFDAKEEGMEGVIAEYTIHKFPNVPYTVTIECRGNAKSQCRDIATLTQDQALLEVLSAHRH